MVTNKLRAIWQVIKSDHVLLFTKSGYDGVKSFGFGKGSLQAIMLMAVEVKKSYNNMVDMVSNAAVETGELHALNELKEAVEKMVKQEPGKHSKGRLSHLQRLVIGFTSTRADQRKKVERRNRRLGRLHNGRH